MKYRKCWLVAIALAMLFAFNGCQNETTQSGNVLDLTTLSSDALHSTVDDIMLNPEAHLGEMIRVRGTYQPVFWDVTGLYYHYIVIDDPDTCCVMSFEFVLRGNPIFPDDFPAEDTLIEITGVFGSYVELEQTFFYLAVDEILIP
jgi:hypothetical protein